ncbi:MAG: carbohydrate ABC transporter substrate-binding protein [Alphaproteobacteria bacterium]|nr:carbohydrate ABC transporter substrate-binding protein [Alphaproteobacteria bacterium]
MKTVIRLLLVASLLLVGGCSGSGSAAGDSARPKVIKLWVAPNETQEEFWKIAVDRWNKSGLGLPVTFTTIPATGSSEKAILTALVSGNAPDISTNIFAGFAAQLADLGQLQELSAMAGYWKLIAARHMGRIIQGWDQGGKKYVFPIYVNPTMIWWRSDILAKLGLKTVPRTFDDVYALSRKYAALDHKYGMQVIAGKNWQDRWFDFISFYYATAAGAPYIKDGKAVYDNAAGRSVVIFLNKMFRQGWTAADFDSDDPLVTGLVAGAVRGPWDIAYFRKIYPDILKKIVIGPMIANHKTEGKTFTFADTKGLVIFKSSRVKKQAFAFISWVFSNDDLSLLWLRKTGLPPARGDLMTNPLFRAFYRSHPLDRQYADYVDVAVPPAFIESTIDVQKTMGIDMIEPIEFGIKTPEAALTDAVRRTNQLLEVRQ